jgi:hypothetical protein
LYGNSAVCPADRANDRQGLSRNLAKEGSMTSKSSTHFDPATPNALAVRLNQRADDVHQFSLQELANDLRRAAATAVLLADYQTRIREIAADALNRPSWDWAAFARDLKEMLDDGEE